MGPCQMFSPETTPAGLWADQDHCPFLCPNPRQYLQRIAQRGISGTPPPPLTHPLSPAEREDDFLAHENMSTASLMHLPNHPPPH